MTVDVGVPTHRHNASVRQGTVDVEGDGINARRHDSVVVTRAWRAPVLRAEVNMAEGQCEPGPTSRHAPKHPPLVLGRVWS